MRRFPILTYLSVSAPHDRGIAVWHTGNLQSITAEILAEMMVESATNDCNRALQEQRWPGIYVGNVDFC